MFFAAAFAAIVAQYANLLPERREGEREGRASKAKVAFKKRPSSRAYASNLPRFMGSSDGETAAADAALVLSGAAHECCEDTEK